MSRSSESELPLPPASLRFMAGDKDDAELLESGRRLVELLRSHGLRDDATVLDVGCGYGRLALGLLGSGFTGRYVGIDILPRPVRWCRRTLTPYSEDRLRFRHLDVRNGRYNPDGAVPPTQLRFPARRAGFDVVAVLSVFTHMYEADIRRYLRETRRVLSPGGRAVTTWFLFDEARLPAVVSPDSCAFPMVNEINAVTRYHDARDPLWAICYATEHVRTMVADAGLEVASLEPGAWCGEPASFGQDVLVLARPAPAPPPSRARRGARRLAGRARRLTRRWTARPAGVGPGSSRSTRRWTRRPAGGG